MNHAPPPEKRNLGEKMDGNQSYWSQPFLDKKHSQHEAPHAPGKTHSHFHTRNKSM